MPTPLQVITAAESWLLVARYCLLIPDAGCCRCPWSLSLSTAPDYSTVTDLARFRG